MSSHVECRFCGITARVLGQVSGGENHAFDCPFCGKYSLSGTAESSCHPRSDDEKMKYRRIPHAIWRMRSKSGQQPILNTNSINQLLDINARVSIEDQCRNIVLEIGNRLPSPGYSMPIHFVDFGAAVGSTSQAEYEFLVRALVDRGLLGHFRPDLSSATLAMDGWIEFEKIKNGASDSDSAFMAMKCGDTELDTMLKDCFQPAADDAGIALRPLNDPENQRAGLIDDRLRVEIQKAKFLICDLTHNNNGAYWEAGYGEGFGKQVIYTCRRHDFEARSKAGGGTHFDTNRHLHILWDACEMDRVRSELTACIKATFPELG